MEKKPRAPIVEGELRSHAIRVPNIIRDCSGIIVHGRRIKSVVFTTDLCIIRNIDADAVIAVYPFTPQPIIVQAILMAADIPVFAGIGGGLTTGIRAITMGVNAEMQGAAGVVLNSPTQNDILSVVAKYLDIPTIITVTNDKTDFKSRVDSGADIFNVAAGADSPAIVRLIRQQFPEFPIIATGGPTEDSIRETIAAGANAISWTPPTTAELFKASMKNYRDGLGHP